MDATTYASLKPCNDGRSGRRFQDSKRKMIWFGGIQPKHYCGSNREEGTSNSCRYIVRLGHVYLSFHNTSFISASIFPFHAIYPLTLTLSQPSLIGNLLLQSWPFLLANSSLNLSKCPSPSGSLQKHLPTRADLPVQLSMPSPTMATSNALAVTSTWTTSTRPCDTSA